MNKPVVVGFDDTEHSTRALELAVTEAYARQAPLHLVHVYRWAPADDPIGTAPGESPGARVPPLVADFLEDAAQRIRKEHPGLTVETVPSVGDPPPMLAAAARDAALLVVGGRGHGGFAGLLLGSTTLRVLPLAGCPVMVVRGDGVPHTGRVMVGVDVAGPRTTGDALEFAFAEAARRKAEVYAIFVWEDPSGAPGGPARLTPATFPDFEERQRELLASVLAPFQERYPSVPVTQQAFPGTVSRMLVESTRLADALVIGGAAEEPDGRRGMRIGALAHIVLHHAHCPVFVVPERTSGTGSETEE